MPLMSLSLRCGHLFNGIGGFPLAASWMGWQNVWHSEIDEYCNKVMARHFPNSIAYGDIKQIDLAALETVDLITGGFPCQPFSLAGEKRGTEDSRHLWPEMLKTIAAVKPRWVVAENVYGIVNWSEGLVFEQVQADLEDEGYQVQSYILPAASVNAPHRRDRVWFVAYSEQFSGNCESNGGCDHKTAGQRGSEQEAGAVDGGCCATRPDSNSNNNGLQGRGDQTELHREGERSEQRSEDMVELLRRQWEDFPTKSPVCGGNDGVPDRVDRIKALGNAIVPQVALQIFKTIHEFETQP